MALGVIEESGERIVEGPPGESLMRRPQDATLVLEACFSARVRGALLYPENLTSQFFDLSSGEAGEVLDKLRRFHVRLAIVCKPGTVRFSSRFLEILSNDLRVFDTREAARLWLGQSPETGAGEPSAPGLRIRRAVPDDAAAIVSILATIAAERIHSAIDHAWTVEQERRYLESLSPREVIHVAVNELSEVIGLQILDRWSSLESMAYVAQVGTFILPAHRGRGVGHRLWTVTSSFAREAGYRKLAIQVRGTNTRAQAFYRGIGFRECGRLARQVVIDGREDDEVLMELFL